MADIIVEDGTGLSNANAYSSMDDSDTYHESVGHSAWIDDSQSDLSVQAKIRGAAYIDRKYSTQWPGTKVNGRSQSMAWPRTNAYDYYGEEIDSESVPREIITAAYEAEWREFQDPGSLSPDVIAAQQVIEERVGSIAVRYSDTSSTSATIPTVTEIDEILASIIGEQRGTNVSLVKRA